MPRSFLTFSAAMIGFVATWAGPPPAAAQEATVHDSADVRVISLPSSLPERDAAVSTTELFRTLGEIDLYRVTDAVFLPGGRLAVANSGSQEVFFFDTDGNLARRYGREGQGPGEFARIRALGLTTEGELWAYDDGLGRITTIPEPGGEPRTRSLMPQDRITSLEPLLVSREGPVLAIRGEHRVFRSSGESRDTVPLFLVDATGATTDTLGWWPGLEKAFTAIGGGSGQLQVGFGRDLYTAAHGGTAVLGSSDSLDLSVYVPPGRLTMKIVGPDRAIHVPREVADAWRTERVESAADYPEFAAAYAEVRVSETFPAFDGLAVDERGRIWIGLHPEGESTQVWWSVGPDGPEAAVTLPAAGTVLAIATNRIAILDRTELGEEYLAVYGTDMNEQPTGAP